MDAPTPPKANSSLRTLDLVPDPGEIIKPAELIDTPTGVDVVARLLGAIESGAYQ